LIIGRGAGMKPLVLKEIQWGKRIRTRGRLRRRRRNEVHLLEYKGVW
jgi:hypothetical protein